MEPTSSTCAVASLTCSQLALAATGLIITGLTIIYLMKSQKNNQSTPLFERLRLNPFKGSSEQFRSNNEKNTTREENFSLLLITTSEKLRGKIEIDNVTDGECNQPVQTETVKNLINTSRHFLIEDKDNNTLNVAKTSGTLPDLEKDSLFILKITGQGKHNIATYTTKLGLRDSITSETCNIEKVLHLLDARIAEKFIPTI